jgi:hypothetical protein
MNYTELTLTSEDTFSNIHCPSNTLSKFRNIFDHTLHWENAEVAISKVTFVGTTWNINSLNYIVYYVNGAKTASQRVLKFPLEKTQITSRQHFIHNLDKAATDHVPELKQLRDTTSVRRIIDHDTAPFPRMKMTVADNCKIYLHNSILKLLGYDDLITDAYDDLRPLDIPNTHYLFPDKTKYNGLNSRIENYFRNDPILFFSCDLAQNTHLYGHKKINSLLEVNLAYLNRGGGELIEYIPPHLSFFPLSRKDFSSAEISIYTGDGTLARLVYGPVIVRMTLRDRETTHNQY